MLGNSAGVRASFFNSLSQGSYDFSLTPSDALLEIKMVYTMIHKVDGACRGNGYPDCIGAAAALRMHPNGKTYITLTRQLTSYDDEPPTNQRAELTAIILALEDALERYHELNRSPRVDLTIFSDSKYAVKCMEKFIYNWSNNGWYTAKGESVKNSDLIKHAAELGESIMDLGTVRYRWRRRENNCEADEACNDVLDAMDDESL